MAERGRVGGRGGGGGGGGREGAVVSYSVDGGTNKLPTEILATLVPFPTSAVRTSGEKPAAVLECAADGTVRTTVRRAACRLGRHCGLAARSKLSDAHSIFACCRWCW